MKNGKNNIKDGKKKHQFFISYAYHRGYGNMIFFSNKKLSKLTIGDIRDMEKTIIEKGNFINVVILNIIEISSEK